MLMPLARKKTVTIAMEHVGGRLNERFDNNGAHRRSESERRAERSVYLFNVENMTL